MGVLPLLILGTLGAGSMKIQPEEIEATGRIYVMGNEPFTQVAIRLDDGRVFALMGEYDKELRALQGKRLTVRGNQGEKTRQGADSIEVKSFQVMETK